ncbi:MAG TPA: hypothetical protein VKA30_11260 [Actinomycetota bacterium]|nr:hypothetical protein [Actinomycetota bacterium]
MRWRYRNDADTEVGWSQDFEDQGGAEQWLGDSWRDLLDEGITTVELMDGDELVYRMGLTPD